MRELMIGKNDSGQRLDKYLKKLLPNASSGFLYKMLRKKNITLNGKKAEGKESLKQGDILRVFFADETFEKFAKEREEVQEEYEALQALSMKGLQVIYEDETILALDKPCNMLSQKAAPQDLSANEYMLGYLIREGALSREDFMTFRPSVCNRLDRNTTGILLAGKTLSGLQELSRLLKSREAHKYYRAIVAGQITESAHLKGYLKKEERSNRVEIFPAEPTQGKLTDKVQWIETSYEPMKVLEDCTLLEIHLITGRSHQIRAHLASQGHPVIGDPKYGDPAVNRSYQKRYHVKSQLLHAYRVELPGKDAIIAPEPAIFRDILGADGIISR